MPFVCCKSGDIERGDRNIWRVCKKNSLQGYGKHYYNVAAHQGGRNGNRSVKGVQSSLDYLYDYLKLKDPDIYDDICCQITDLEKQYIELVDKYLTLKI